MRVRLEQILDEFEVHECSECGLVAFFGLSKPEDSEPTCIACGGKLLKVIP